MTGLHNSSRMVAAIVVGIALFFLGFLPAGVYSTDGNSMLQVAESIVAHHDVTVSAGFGTAGADGRMYSNWYPLLSILVVPLVGIAYVCTHFEYLEFLRLASPFALLIQIPLTAATAGLVALLSLELGATRRGAWMAAISFCFGTVALVYARTFFAEPLLAFLVIASVYVVFRLTPRAIAASSVLTALAVLAKPTGILVGPILTAYLLAKQGVRWKTFVPVAGSMVGLCIYAIYNQIRFGKPLQFGQPWIFSVASLPSGLAGLLVSPAWGLLWYSPVVILAIWGFREAVRSKFFESLTVVAIFMTYLIFHSFYGNWFAGWGWGPRYLVPPIPILCSLSGLLEGRGRKALVILSAVGFLIGAPTLVIFYEKHFEDLLTRNLDIGAGLGWKVPLASVLNEWPTAIRHVAGGDYNVWWWSLRAGGTSLGVGLLLSVIFCRSWLVRFGKVVSG